MATAPKSPPRGPRCVRGYGTTAPTSSTSCDRAPTPKHCPSSALSVPEEWCALWEANDGGGVLFDGWTWVPIQGVVDSVIAEHALLEMAEQLDADRRRPTDGPVQAVWAHPDWIPFAVDFGGCLLCIDLAPLMACRRQVILVPEDHRRVLCDGAAPSL